MKSKKRKTLETLAFTSMGICIVCFAAWMLREAEIVKFTTPEDMTRPAFTFGLIAFGLLSWSQNMR